MGSYVNRAIIVNDTFVSYMPDSSYTRIALPEGTYQFNITEKAWNGTALPAIDEISVKAGQVYFFTMSYQIHGVGVFVGSGSYRLTAVPAYEAKRKILGDPSPLKLVDNPYNR